MDRMEEAFKELFSKYFIKRTYCILEITFEHHLEDVYFES